MNINKIKSNLINRFIICSYQWKSIIAFNFHFYKLFLQLTFTKCRFAYVFDQCFFLHSKRNMNVCFETNDLVNEINIYRKKVNMLTQLLQCDQATRTKKCFFFHDNTKWDSNKICAPCPNENWQWKWIKVWFILFAVNLFGNWAVFPFFSLTLGRAQCAQTYLYWFRCTRRNNAYLNTAIHNKLYDGIGRQLLVYNGFDVCVLCPIKKRALELHICWRFWQKEKRVETKKATSSFQRVFPNRMRALHCVHTASLRSHTYCVAHVCSKWNSPS